MFCKNCGKEIDSQSIFCSHCGTKVQSNEDSDVIRQQQAHDEWRAQMAARMGQSKSTTVGAPPQSPRRVRSKTTTVKEKPAPKVDYSSYSVPISAPPSEPPKKIKKSIFKRWWFWVVVVGIVGSIVSSGGNSGDPQNQDHSQLSEKETAATEAPLSITESILYDEDGIRITVKGIEDTFTGTDIKLLIENDTEKNIAVSCSDFVVNGITVHGYLYLDAAAGKKANGEISFNNTTLETAGIKQIATIKSFDAYISDTDTYHKTKDIAFEIATSIAEGYTQTVNDTGEVLFEQNGFTVIAKNLSDDYWGGTVVVLFKNDSGEDVIVQADNVSINGYTVSVLHSDAVCNGTVRFCEIDLFQSDLEENEIENIEEVTFELSVLNPKTFQTIARTGELRVAITD